MELHIERLPARRCDTERRLIPLPGQYSLVDSRYGAGLDNVEGLQSYIHLLIHHRDTESTELSLLVQTLAAGLNASYIIALPP